MNLKHQYSENIKNQRILIFGPELPPIGGVSVHISRVSEKYKENLNETKIIDVSKEIKNRSRIKYGLFVIKTIFHFKPTQIDYHTSHLDSFMFELFGIIILKFFLKYKLLFIDHDPRYLYKKNKSFKIFFNFLNKFVEKQIIIGDSTHKSYLNNKIFLHNFIIESSFLPPSKLEIESAQNIIYPHKIQKFLEKQSPIILFNAFEFTLMENQDLYGFDRAVGLMKKLKNEFENIGLLILCSQVGNKNYFKKIEELIKQNNLNDNISILFDNYPLWPLFRKSHIFIRPTRSDSYGISVEEAITFNVPAIASNVCLRHEAAILFDNNSEEDFYIKTYDVIKKLEKQ